MKNKKSYCFVFVFFITVFFISNAFAVTAPCLRIWTEEEGFDGTELYAVTVGGTWQLYAVIAQGNDYGGATGWFTNENDLKDVIWSSSNKRVAKVDNNGKVTGKSEGTATITAQYTSARGEKYETETTITVINNGANNKSDTLIKIIIIGTIVLILVLIIMYKKSKKKN